MGDQDHSQRYVTSPGALLQIRDHFCCFLDLKAGVREKTVLAAFHPQAIELFNVSSDLKRVCYFLADPHLRLDQKVSHDRPRLVAEHQVSLFD